MTGKQIAANLRKSRRRWGRKHLFRNKAYCVLGLKAIEAGVPKEALLKFRGCYPDSLTDLIALNDGSTSKRDLISVLESGGYAEHNWPVENFIKQLKSKYRYLYSA